MSYTNNPMYKYYERRQEERSHRKVAKADLPFLQEIPEPYEIDDVIVEDEFAVVQNPEFHRWYIDEAGNNGETYDQDFYVSLMIGWKCEEYQALLAQQFGANKFGANMYFDTEAQAVEAMSWVSSMRTLAKMSGTDTITFEEN